MIGRLRGSYRGVDRRRWVKPASFDEPVFFMPRNDTHERVDELLTVRSVTKTKRGTAPRPARHADTSYVKEEKPTWHRKK